MARAFSASSLLARSRLTKWTRLAQSQGWRPSFLSTSSSPSYDNSLPAQPAASLTNDTPTLLNDLIPGPFLLSKPLPKVADVKWTGPSELLPPSYPTPASCAVYLRPPAPVPATAPW